MPPGGKKTVGDLEEEETFLPAGRWTLPLHQVGEYQAGEYPETGRAQGGGEEGVLTSTTMGVISLCWHNRIDLE